MRIYSILLLAYTCLTGFEVRGQAERVLIRLPITNYIVVASDSVTIVQVLLPTGSAFTIKQKTIGVVNHLYQLGKDHDTTVVGYGRCTLIKGDYYYFGLRMNMGQTAKAGDLISLKVEMAVSYRGLLFDASRNHILFTAFDDKPFYDWQLPFGMKTAAEEEFYFTRMVNDIKYVGENMAKQNPQQNREIKNGLFAKQKIFDAMQKTTASDLKAFFKYMKAKPAKYAGNTWRISEIFATWMAADTLQLVE